MSLFPGFRSEHVDVGGVRIRAVVGPARDAPAVLLRAKMATGSAGMKPFAPEAWAEYERCFKPMDEWRRVAEDVRGRSLPAGHYLPEEVPELVAQELERFFG